eukprot:XP_019859067.1 PREDICTED: uncharacterized protein LOC109587266 [Amphimedon queenslandica]
MLYLSVFLSSFLSATLIPLASEVALAAALKAGANLHWALTSAIAGNTLGACVNWILGRYIERWRDKPWFPVSRTQLEKGSAWFRKYGVWSLLLSWMPLVGDALPVIAGLMRVHFLPFVVLVGIGKTLRYIVFVMLLEGTVL